MRNNLRKPTLIPLCCVQYSISVLWEILDSGFSEIPFTKLYRYGICSDNAFKQFIKVSPIYDIL